MDNMETVGVGPRLRSSYSPDRDSDSSSASAESVPDTKETRKKNRANNSLRFLSDRLVDLHSGTQRWKEILLVDGFRKIHELHDVFEDKDMFEATCQELTVILEKMQEQVKVIKDNARHVYSTWVLVDDDEEIYDVNMDFAKAFKSWTFYDYSKITQKMTDIYEKLQSEKVELASKLVNPDIDREYLKKFVYLWSATSLLTLEFEQEIETMFHDAGLKTQDFEDY